MGGTQIMQSLWTSLPFIQERPSVRAVCRARLSYALGLEQEQDGTALLSWSLHSSRETGKKPTNEPIPDLEDFIEGSTQSTEVENKHLRVGVLGG